MIERTNDMALHITRAALQEQDELWALAAPILNAVDAAAFKVPFMGLFDPRGAIAQCLDRTAAQTEALDALLAALAERQHELPGSVYAAFHAFRATTQLEAARPAVERAVAQADAQGWVVVDPDTLEATGERVFLERPKA